MLSDFFKKAKYITIPMAERVRNEVESELPADMWTECPKCGRKIVADDYESAYKVCPHCGHHARLTARERLLYTVDADSFQELDGHLKTKNPLNFEGYSEKIELLREKNRMNDAVVTGRATIEQKPVCIGVMDSFFMMASMGSVVGEKLTRLFELAEKERLPVILFTASGGARMQEGILSLMQMAKVSGAVGRHSEAGGLYITVLTDPTTGGVTASFAMLGDIILAEPGATVGFAGRRVIEGTISQKLPADFQLSEFQQAHGFVDAIVPRGNMRAELSWLLDMHGEVSADE
ncbi:acetyl-CoA carboxylase, carboxyltransferase subunit beta [Oscillospiraceae bacterium OttesenSCG-928-F05]|nr:acetyl-CoA carboxylase, carboxyltransferase subunit beta [Oscillospiraceae bacterium OttesenSCG-928-F05]